jgi:hypothetical protein
LGARSDISMSTEFGASAYRAMLRNGLQSGLVSLQRSTEQCTGRAYVD